MFEQGVFNILNYLRYNDLLLFDSYPSLLTRTYADRAGKELYAPASGWCAPTFHSQCFARARHDARWRNAGHDERLRVDKTRRFLLNLQASSATMARTNLNRVVATTLLLVTVSLAFHDVGDVTIPTAPPVPYTASLPRHVASTLYEQWDRPPPSMITAIAPSMAMMANGEAVLQYSIHFHNHAAGQHQLGQGIFKRGVFANDPPLSTCQQCSNGTPLPHSVTFNQTGFTSIPCSTIPYSVSLPITNVEEIY